MDQLLSDDRSLISDDQRTELAEKGPTSPGAWREQAAVSWSLRTLGSALPVEGTASRLASRIDARTCIDGSCQEVLVQTKRVTGGRN